MRIDRIRVDGFGKLAGLDTGAENLPGMVVVLGRNEAGKSTLFAFLTTMFYGFQPATREGNPHTPWGASEASGRVRIRLADGLPADVERKLRSQPSARLAVGGAAREIRNLPLPWVEHVPRGVFRQVFAITAKELAGLDPETWARIQDKMVGSMGTSDLRSPRAVADALETEAGEIWRPNRRGNQRLRALQADIRALRARRIAAHERDATLRALAEERAALDERATAVRAERHRMREAIDRVQIQLPLRRQIERVASLRAEGGDRASLDGLPDDPLERFEALESERAASCARVATLDAELGELGAAVAAFDARARGLVARRTEIVHLIARSASCDADRARAREVAGQLAAVEARLDATAEPLLSGGWREQQDEIGRIPVAVLEDRLSRTAAPAPSRGLDARAAGALVVVALAGIALLVWGMAGSRPLPIAIGAAAAAVAVAALALQSRATGGRARAGAAESPPAALPRSIRLQPSRQGPPTRAVLSEIARLQALLAERAGHVSAASTARARYEEVDRAVAELARALEVADTADPAATCAALDAELRSAERSREDAERAEREMRRATRERQEVGARLAQLATALAALESAGARFVRDDARRGLEIARARIAAHARADRLEEEIERMHPDLRELEAQMRAERSGVQAELALDTVDLPAMKARLEELESEAERLLRRSEAIDADARRLRDAETVDSVDGELATLKEREERLGAERDRKLVLARILREADRRFREEHQPDLLRRAGAYLSHLTGGRYERLVVDECDASHPFGLVGPGLPAPVPLAAPISTGTLEQAYLSLRLAIVDHLDRGGERLPLFVDEVFVNWDAERRARGIEVLTGIAPTRQVFVFTCHPEVAHELVGRGGRLLDLDRVG
ncbi:MAG: AAA family ATPase [Gemmatimonadales bacterium]